MALAKETIYLGRDNKFDKRLEADDVIQNLSSVTKVGVLFNGNYYHSDNWPDAFDYATQAADGIITFDLASISSIAAGRDTEAEIIIYDATNPQGIIWDTFDLEIIALTGTEVTP